MLLIFSTEHGEGSGAEVVLEHLLKGWNATFIPIMVAAPMNSRIGRTVKALDIPHIALNTAKDSIVDNNLELMKIKNQLSHVTHVHAWHSRNFELATLAAKFLGISSSATFHDHPEICSNGTMRRAVMKYSMNRMSKLVSVSDANKDAWVKAGCQPQIDVIRNGLVVSDSVYQESDKLRIGYLGMGQDWKGFDIVAKWLHEDFADNVHWQLYGTPTPRNEGLVKELESTGRSNFTVMGRKTPGEIFSEIDLLVHTSTEFDPLPTVLIESLQAGIPALASKCGGSAEIISVGESGFIFGPDRPEDGLKSLREMLDSADMREKFGVKAKEIFRTKFSIDRMVSDYNDFWKQFS